MRILYLITGLRMGGAEKQLLLLSSRIQRAGNTVLVVAMEPRGSLVQKFEETGITVKDLGITGVINLLSGYKRFEELVYEFQPDIIHAHMIHANLFGRLFRLFNKRHKLICTAHNIREGNELMMRAYTLTERFSDWSTNVSGEAYDYFLSKGFFNSGTSSCMLNAIDTEAFSREKTGEKNIRDEFQISLDKFVFLAVGRLEPQKNFMMLLDCFAAVHKQIKNVFLVIAGDGPLKAALLDRIRRLDLQDSILLSGRRDDIPELMAAANCLVLSSSFEGFGLVVAEAMAMEVPVIACDCGGVREVMGGFGKLIEKENPAALTEAMIKSCGEQISSSTLSQARTYIENHYAVEKIVDQWTNLYTRLA